MHPTLIIRTVSIIFLIICGFMIFPIIWALVYNETALIPSFLIPMAVAIVTAAIIFSCTRRKQATLSARDGFLLVSLSWITAALAGTLPFYLSGTIPRFTDAFFETMSGFTTTGASILTEIETLPRSMLFWRSLTHWLGGMGIVVLTVAILPLLGIGAYQLLKAEAPGPSMNKLTPRIAQTAKILWFLYLGLTVLETLFLLIGGMSLFDALTHTFGTLATGGFSPRNTSVGYYNSAYIDIVITVFMIMAGINFVLYFQLITGKIRNILSNIEMRVYLSVFFIITLLITFTLLQEYGSFGRSLRYASFQTASILTTTGYATADFSAWPGISKMLLFLLMFIGGCSGSTGGGIKVIRVTMMAKLAWHEMKYMVHPNRIFRLGHETREVSKAVTYPIAAFLFIYLLLLLITSLVVASAGNGVLTSFSAALVTVGNIGPGFGKIGPVENYAFLPDYVKWFLSFAMMAGRLELYTLLVIFTPAFWRS